MINGDMIEIEDLIIGRAYEGTGRWFSTGIWTGTVFIGVRSLMPDHIIESEIDVRAGGTFKPLELLVSLHII